jgi:hypothetical protein
MYADYRSHNRYVSPLLMQSVTARVRAAAAVEITGMVCVAIERL